MNYYVSRGGRQYGPYLPVLGRLFCKSLEVRTHQRGQPPLGSSRCRDAWLAAVIAVGLAACLYWLPPWQYGLYPHCPILALTGWQCPGCGMTRALAALLRGRIRLSWHYNPLVLLSLPWLGAYGILRWRGVRLRLPQSVILGILVMVVLFGVGRNLHLFAR